MYIDLCQRLRQAAYAVPALAVLEPDNAFVRVMLLQPHGNLVADDQKIGNAEGPANIKHQEFWNLVFADQPQLAVAPEYSTPWSVIRTLLQAEQFPDVGNIWVVGAESIRPVELNELRAEFPDIVWQYDLPEPMPANRRYLDPVLFIFRVRRLDPPAAKLCIAIQFKCREMGGDYEHIERDNLILGTYRYYIENSENSIRLTALICSDSIGFSQTILPQHLFVPYLVIHIQCATDPYRALLKQYRDATFLSAAGERYNFISLNWAADSQVNGEDMQNAFGGSCYYMKPRELTHEPRQTDAWIDANHVAGGYLKFCRETRNAAFYFAPSEHVLDFAVTKVSQAGSPVANQDYAGIQNLSARHWSNGHWTPVAHVDDGIKSLIQGLGINSLAALFAQPATRERLLALCTGSFKAEKEWHLPNRFRSYEVAHASELPSGTLVRLRAPQDQEIGRTLQVFATLEAAILPNHAAYPAEFRDLHGKVVTLDMGAVATTYVNNLAADATPIAATMVFLGDTPQAQAQRFLDDFRRALAPNRLAVWFRQGMAVHVLSLGFREYSSPEMDPTDIARGTEHG